MTTEHANNEDKVQIERKSHDNNTWVLENPHKDYDSLNDAEIRIREINRMESSIVHKQERRVVESSRHEFKENDDIREAVRQDYKDRTLLYLDAIDEVKELYKEGEIGNIQMKSALENYKRKIDSFDEKLSEDMSKRFDREGKYQNREVA